MLILLEISHQINNLIPFFHKLNLPCRRCGSPLRHLLVSLEDISCIYLIFYIIQTSIIAVGYDSLALCLECCHIIYYSAAKEGCTIFQCRLVDNHLCTLCLDSLHDALDSRLAEVITVTLHRQAINSYHTVVFLTCIITIGIGIAVITSLSEHGIGNIVFSCTVTLNNCFYQVLRNIGIVCQKLLGILWQSITTIAETWVIVMGSNTWIKTYAINDCLGIQAFDFGVCIQFIEIAYS